MGFAAFILLMVVPIMVLGGGLANLGMYLNSDPHRHRHHSLRRWRRARNRTWKFAPDSKVDFRPLPQTDRPITYISTATRIQKST